MPVSQDANSASYFQNSKINRSGPLSQWGRSITRTIGSSFPPTLAATNPHRRCRRIIFDWSAIFFGFHGHVNRLTLQIQHLAHLTQHRSATESPGQPQSEASARDLIGPSPTDASGWKTIDCTTYQTAHHTAGRPVAPIVRFLPIERVATLVRFAKPLRNRLAPFAAENV